MTGRPRRTPLPPRYVDLGHLARGGSSEIRRVRDTLFERDVAMKILSWRHAEIDGPRRRRFHHEARITASLEHPGVVPIFDRGTLGDGRPWFTMKEIRGRTLGEMIRGLHARPMPLRDASVEGWTFRRLVDALARTAEAVGYAHRKGIVHRDLKPQNVMLGAFGEVLVVDWGIALEVDEPPLDGPAAADALRLDDVGGSALTEDGDLVGTIAYMAPEQARGEREALGPTADVYALGLVLYELLAGQRAFPGSPSEVWSKKARGVPPPRELGDGAAPPAALVDLVTAATLSDPAERLADGAAFAMELRRWLDGEDARARARELVAQAARREQDLEELHGREQERRRVARKLLAQLRDPDPESKKLPAWRIEDEADELAARIRAGEGEVIELLRAALRHDPEIREGHARLASLYARALERETHATPERQEELTQRLARHDDGRHEVLVEGAGTLTVSTEPEGADVTVLRYEEVDRRLVPRPFRHLGRTPVVSARLPAGSYLLLLDRPGHELVRYPVRIARGRHASLLPPGAAHPRPVFLPPAGTLPGDEIYVAGGWTTFGGDPDAIEPLARYHGWLDAFVIQRDPVTVAAYAHYLQSLLDGGDVDACEAALPRWTDEARLFGIREGRVEILAPPLKPSNTSSPVRWVSAHQAELYARWKRQREGLPWRLPTEREWEKAARGADERPFPWGFFPEVTWAVTAASGTGMEAASVDDERRDVSPYGMRHVVGNVRNWCSDGWSFDGVHTPAAGSPYARWRIVRGGAFMSNVRLDRIAGRWALPPERQEKTVGFRLARSLPTES
ncbi:MAG: SUMF1/EgtB/PvdO family nonheme iron enzyme [Myxococcota bacterium]